ncbi:MAG: hypothetical protein QXU98_11665 [Candidatus Parvarchaeota archaeon]
MVKKALIPALTIPGITVAPCTLIGPITSNTSIAINTRQVLVVAVGGGGAGGGTDAVTVQAGSGGNTVVTNGSQTITAGGGQGGWAGNYAGSQNVCVGCYWGPGGSGGTGSVQGVQYYQILNGNAGGNGGGGVGGSGGALPSGYNTAIQQVLQEAGISCSISLSIPSTLCKPTQSNSDGSPGSGYGAGGCGNGGSSSNGGGGGGSGAVVVAIMNGGTFNITVGQGGQPSPSSSGVTYSCLSCSTGLPGVVYLVPLP